MRIELTTRAAADALADYLRHCECSVAFVDDCTLEAAPRPRSQSLQEQQIELDAYLRVWKVMHADERITVLGRAADSTHYESNAAED
jgi:hypothetical protein